jgi:hypothetical protein
VLVKLARGLEEDLAERRVVAGEAGAPGFADTLAAEEVIHVEGSEDIL